MLQKSNNFLLPNQLTGCVFCIHTFDNYRYNTRDVNCVNITIIVVCFSSQISVYFSMCLKRRTSWISMQNKGIFSLSLPENALRQKKQIFRNVY